MKVTARSREPAKLGRASTKLHAELRAAIVSGEISGGGFIPTQRELSSQYGVAHTTVRRALKKLEVEGLIASEPRRGFRVLPRASDPDRGCPLAYVADPLDSAGRPRPFHSHLLVSLRLAAGRRGWSMLALGSEGSTVPETIAGMRSQRAFGVVLNTTDAELLRAIERWGVPAVVVNDWAESARIDSIIQDGHQGGLLAARHLCERGARRIAWFGPLGDDVHSLERFGGVAAGLQQFGAGLPPELVVETGSQSMIALAHGLLSRRDRPEGVITMWRGCTLAVRQAAEELGLEVGRDFELVGWCPQELYDTTYLPAFEGGPVAPAVVWSVATMAETALSRLAERRENPDLPALRVKVPTTLRVVVKPGEVERHRLGDAR